MTVSESFSDDLPPARYEICLLGRLDEKWLVWFDGVQTTSGREEDHKPLTILTCTVVDQARLRGILNQLWDLNLTLIS